MGKSYVMDFTDVKEQSGFNPAHQPAGDYRGRIKSWDESKAKETNNVLLNFAVVDVDRPSAVYRYSCTMTPKSMWKIRNLIVACGLTNPTGKKVKIDPDRLVGRELGMTLDDDEYNDRLRSQIVNVFPASELEQTEVADDTDDDDDEDEVEEAPPAKKAAPARRTTAAKKKAAAVVEDDEDEEDLDELDIDDL